MADSTLDITGEEPPNTGRGHGTEALGPSDTSDTGSDVAGGPGLRDELGLGLDRGTTEDPGSAGTSTAAPDIGDGNLDSDSDSSGTGERASAGRDGAVSDRDISVDQVITGPDGAIGGERDVDLSDLDPDPDADRDQDAGDGEVARYSDVDPDEGLGTR
jgi:hypothetical protein